MFSKLALLLALQLGKPISVTTEPSIKLTHHAQLRMLQRGITENDILHTLKTQKPIQTNNERLKYCGSHMTVVTNSTSRRIITVYKKSRVPKKHTKLLNTIQELKSLAESKYYALRFLFYMPIFFLRCALIE